MFRSIHSLLTNRRTAKLAVAGAAAAIGSLATAVSVQAAGLVYEDLNANGYNETASYDINADNFAEYIYIDSDENKVWDIYVYSTGNWSMLQRFNTGSVVWVYRDTAGNWLYTDADGNGRYESLGYDTNRDGKSEYVKADNNGDGSYDGNWITVQPATTLTPYGAAVKTALDIWMTGVNNRMVAVWLT